MKQQIFSVFLAMCLCFSSPSAVYAQQEAPPLQVDVHGEESTSGPAARDGTIPSPGEAYEAMIALKDQDSYKEGTPWTNDEPYSDSKGYYRWKGGTLGGKNIVAVGCVAFAFILSDAAFGSLPARMYAAGQFSFENIKVGDILRVSNDAHTVIVLEVSEAGVVVAEGNVSTGDHKGKIHWGRTISKNEVMSNTSHYITRYPEGYIPPNDPSANEIIKSGTLAGGLTWKLTKAGTLTVSGRGAMPDYSSAGEPPWSQNTSQIRKIVIENGVTAIGSCAFWKCRALSADLPSSVQTIGNSAFRESSLIYMTIPSGVKSVGEDAFHSCAGLSSVTVSEGVETIGQRAFYACTSLTSITLPASVGEVGAAAFFQCMAMTSAKFKPGNKQVKMGDDMFAQCYYLLTVTLPKSIDRISARMFQNCLMLAGVEIPQGTQNIEGLAFASSGVSVVIIPDSITTIGSAAFSACRLTDIYYTGSEAQWNRIIKVGDTASAVSKAEIHYNYIPPATPDPDPDDGNGGGNTPDNGSGSGSGGTPDNGSGSGSGGTPDNGSGSGSGDKPDNSSGSGNGGKPDNGSGNEEPPEQPKKPFAKGKTFTVGKITYKVTKVGKEVQLTASKSAAKKITVNTVIGTDGVKYKVTAIGTKAMQKNKKITSLVLGSNVKTIGANAFYGCTKLSKITFGKNVASVGTNAFRGCTSLKKTVTLPDSIKTIGSGAFSGCKMITAVTIGKTSKSNLKTLGKSTFYGCKKLGKITIQSRKLGSVGKQICKGTKSSLKVKVPSKQLTKYRKLFKKAGLKTKQVTK